MKKGWLTRIRKSEFDGYNYVGNFSHIYKCKFGKMSYCGSKCNLFYTKIGSFCSIASNVSIIFGDHPINGWVSTHPAFYSPNNSIGFSFVSKNKFNEYKFLNNDYMVEIGNDVWIASNVLIISNVRINDGAVILPGAVVTKDVPPFSICGGVPARVIKYRFDKKIIEFLLSVNWWNKDEEWIKKYHDSFDNIEKFVKEISNEHKD